MPNSAENNHQALSGTLTVAAAFIIMAVFGGTSSAFGVFFKPVMNEFGWTRALTSGAIALSFITHGIASLGLGRLTDRFGPRIVLMINGLFMGAGYILLSSIGEAWQLYLYYSVVIGIGNAVHVPLLATMVRRFKARKGLTTGIVLGGIGAGQVIVPPAAAYLISTYDWQLSFAILGITALVVMLAAAQFLKNPRAEKEIPAALPNKKSMRAVEFSLPALSMRKVALSRQFWILVVINFSVAFCVQGITVHIIPYATDIGIAPLVAASILSFMGAAMMLGRIGIGVTADRISEGKTLVACLITLMLTLCGLLLAGEVWYLYLFGMLFGFSTGVLVLGSTLIARIWGPRAHARIFSVINLFIAFGAASSPYVFGYIHDVTASYRTAFLTDISLAFAGIVLALILCRDLAKSSKTFPVVSG